MIPKSAKPIILRDYESQALASGRLGAIARVVKPHKYNYIKTAPNRKPAEFRVISYDTAQFVCLCEPPYRPGDYLWCKQTWAIGKVDCGEEPDGTPSQPFVSQCAGENDLLLKADVEQTGIYIEEATWSSPVTMPREACRHILRVKSVEVCRAREITHPQRIEMGIEKCGHKKLSDDLHCGCSLGELRRLHDSAIKPADRGTYGYEANPLVWFVTVERVGA